MSDLLTAPDHDSEIIELDRLVATTKPFADVVPAPETDKGPLVTTLAGLNGSVWYQ